MATTITAYLSEDGQVHRSLAEAEFQDYSVRLTRDIKDFLIQEGIVDKDGAHTRLVAKWDLWRYGGYAGWLAQHQEAPAAVPAAVPAPPAPPPVERPAPAPVDRAALATPARPVEPTRDKREAPLRAPRESPRDSYRRRIAVIGLPNQHHRLVEKEFGDEFKLQLIDYANSMPKLESLKAYHKVIVMTRHAHPKTAEILRRIGQEPLQLHGDLEALREALTALYLADVPA